MATKQERIARLKRGIASPETPAHVKESMKELLEELEAPEPDPQIAIDAANARKAEEEAINQAKAEKERANAEKQAAREAKEAKRIALNKKNLERRHAKNATPPPPPAPTITAEKKAELRELYAQRLAKKKAKKESE